MARTSKIQPASTKPKQAAPLKDERTEFYCCRCQKQYKRQKANFPASQSSLYKGNGGYLAICNNCVDELFEHYKAALGNEADAIRRVCLKFDIYWNPEIYSMLNKASTSQSRVRAYISKTNLYKYIGKTFDDTLDEEYAQKLEAEAVAQAELEAAERAREESIIKSVEPVYGDDENDIVVDENIIQYWGTGFTPEMYIELEGRRNYWLSQYPPGTVLNPGEEGILRQICNLEISINQDRAAGKPIEKSVNALNTLFGSMNMKPSQKKETEENYVPFGVEIARFEDGDPIPEPDEDFKDVDGMRHNILTWFLGSLCKTAGIKNEYSQMFEDEIGQYTVERPKYDDSDDDVEEGETVV